MDKRIKGTIGILAAACMALSLGACGSALSGATDALPTAAASGLDLDGNPITVEIRDGSFSMEASTTYAETLTTETDDPQSAAFAAILEGKLAGKLTGNEATDKEAFLAALAEAQAEYAASLVPVQAPRATANNGSTNIRDKAQYFDTFVRNGLSGDINIYWDANVFAAGHSSIWNKRNGHFLHSGGETTLSSGAYMRAGANYYPPSVIREMAGNWECRMVRVNRGVNASLVADAIDAVATEASRYGYSIHANRDDVSQGTYCNQIPYLVWKRLGANISDGYNQTYTEQVLSHYVTTTCYFLWWSWPVQTPVYVTVTRTRFVPYTYASVYDFATGTNVKMDLITGTSILDDNDTSEILCSK